MGLHKPSDIPKLEEISANDEINQLLDSISEFGMEETSQDILQQLSQTEPFYPVIQVHGKCLLLAVISKRFKCLVWLSTWFEVDYDTLYPKDIITLSRYGLIINFDYADKLSAYILRQVAKLEVEERSDGIGFVMHGGELTFKAYDEEPQILQYTHGITLSEYTEGLNKLLTNTAIMFALCCSCASLFFAYLSIVCGIPIMSLVISFYGKSTTGKSTAQTLMASVFTNPKDKKIFIPFFGTLNAIVKNIANKFGVPQLFDEATVSSGLNMESLLYAISLEQDKNRCGSNADLKESDTWKLIVITSSENMLLPENCMHNRGLDSRLLSFELKFTDDREHSDRIHEFCSRYHGILGKALSDHLLAADREEMVEMYDDCKGMMRNAIEDVSSFDIAEKLVNEYALILLTAKVLTDFGICIDINGIIGIMAENSNDIRDRTNIAEKYYQHLVTYAIMNPYAEGIKKDEANNTVAFIDELFLKVLKDYGASNTNLVIDEMDAAGYIFRRKPNALKNRLRFNGKLVNCYEIILPKDDSESDDGCMTLEYVLTHFEGLEESW